MVETIKLDKDDALMVVPPGKLVAIYASDWGFYSEQISLTYDFELVKGWIYGRVVKETDDMIVVAHQVFDSEEGRHVSTIPKSNIFELYELRRVENQ